MIDTPRLEPHREPGLARQPADAALQRDDAALRPDDDAAMEPGVTSSRRGAGAAPARMAIVANEQARRDRAMAVREAIVLPLLFLTVALAGGFRVLRESGQLVFLVPSLMALVLALLLLGVLFRAGALVPERLVHPLRPQLGNLSGTIVLATLFAAAAQVFNTVTPEAGLLQFLFNVFFLFLLWNTVAARPDRRRLLHSLVVLFGGAFLLKYVVLSALYDPQSGLTKRVLTTLLEGVTLGGLTYQAPAPATGYVAFFTILLFLIGLILLPRSDES